jgi:hypothetical protein
VPAGLGLRTMRPGGPVQALVAVQLAVIVAGAIGTVARLPVFALGDEQAHCSYAQIVADYAPWTPGCSAALDMATVSPFTP